MAAMQDLLHALLNPSPLGLAIAILLAVTIPIFLHSVVFRSSGLTTLPSILLIGPSGSGKTSLITLFERGTKAAATHTSQTPIAVECSLPVGAVASSDKYRSDNDPTNQTHKKFLLIDTPGHGKLRHHALASLTNPQNLKGLIFLVDAATLSAGDEGLRQTADYLHDVLLLLQKRVTGSKAAKAMKEIPVLIAANKMDLFIALPAALVKSSLEAEITKVRTSRSKGLLDSGIGMGDAEDEKDDWLGEMGSTSFKFSQMEEFDISVEVLGGNVVGGEGPTVDKWWKWISERL
ncbi:P-loop containing nucleoside triphosphate hydrolase protein [Hyaloscypha bicolor E]|uniref:Signal recognition particle receptor subunit beta n=1 Tax=Hyaloscypha bicolor E TaxID=1095630 RepID=A0A2J6SX96_9HELO|nr:P-loop containing nucleoside triphosphate hydrolase protein [Hyaloscypha bicolor E]PMD55283.1 P-loop containing nucleoside triphosphate hydrolase protein [Hyaloscypha bicolor E]